MNEQNANNLNQNTVAPVTPVDQPENVVSMPAVETPAPVQVDAVPAVPVAPQPVAAPVEQAVPAAPAAPVAPQPVATPVQPQAVASATPVAPVQPTPVAPVTPAAPVQAAPVQPAPAMPAAPVNPMGPVTQQPMGTVPVMAPEQAPKKKSNLPFIIIVVVLVLVIVGLVVAFVLNNNKSKDETKSSTETKETTKEEETKKEETPAEPVSTANSYQLGGYTFTFPESYIVEESIDVLTITDKSVPIMYIIGVDNWYTYAENKADLSTIESEFVSTYNATITDRGEKNIGSKTWYIITGTLQNGTTLTFAIMSFNNGTFIVLENTLTSDYSSGLQTIGGIADKATSSSSFAKGEKPEKGITLPKVDFNLE